MMIVACPQCATRFEVDDAAIPPGGRKVKCAQCAHVWAARPEAAAPVTRPPERPAPPQRAAAQAGDASDFEHDDDDQAAEDIWNEIDSEAEAPPRRRIAAALGLFVLTAALAGLVVFREAVVRSVPALGPVYARLGLASEAPGVSIRSVTYAREFEGETPVLSVSGEVVNLSGREMNVPEVRVALRDADAAELYVWTFHVDVKVLKPGQSVAFRTRLASPPAAARDAVVRFASAK